MKTSRHLRSHLAHPNTYFMFSNIFRNSCRLCDNVENMSEPERPQMVWRMRSTFWITKATETHSEYVIHCFSATTVFTLYVHWLSSYFLANKTARLPPFYKTPITKGLRTYLKWWFAQCAFTTVLLYSCITSPVRKWEHTYTHTHTHIHTHIHEPKYEMQKKNFAITYLLRPSALLQCCQR